MDSYYIVLLIVGMTSLIASFLPIVLKRLKISFTIPLLLVGAVLYYFNAPLPWPDPVWPLEFALRFSELVVIISLMIAGLKIGLNYSWEEWKSPLSLITITMPLFMLVVFLLSYYLLDFSLPVSVLLAAVLAPTDPALASEIQLNDKQTNSNKNTGLRYHLTAEAGINDGLAFPFVFLAILLSKESNMDFGHWAEWLGFYFFYKIIIGSIIGMVVGFLYSYYTQKMSETKENKIHQAFVAVSLTLIAYSIAEITNSYGFLSVFFAGLFANYHLQTKNKKTLSDPNLNFIANFEKFLIIFWIIFFGGSIVAGILNFITWPSVFFSIVVVLIMRPVLGYIGLYKSKLSHRKKLATAFFGIRGIGSVFYLTYALKHGAFEDLNQLYSIVALIILISIVFHGVTAKRAIIYFSSDK